MSQKTVEQRLVNLKNILIISNDGVTKSDKLPDMFTDFYYYESILNETIRAQIIYADNGQTVQKNGVYKTLLDGLPLNGKEKTSITMVDPQGVEIKVDLFVNKISPITKDSLKSLVGLEFVSKEGLLNFKSVLNKRYDGKISDHIRSILTDSKLLGSQKKLDIEETENTLNFTGDQRRPFYALNWLAKKAVPKTQNAKGNTAGFFFFETSDGFKFKSIDGMLSEIDPSGGKKKIKSFAYNQTVDLPSGYDGKILELVPPTPSGDMQTKDEAGTYSTRTILFNPFDCYYEVITPNSQVEKGLPGSESNLQKAGKNLPKLNPELNRDEQGRDFTRTQYILLDTGTLPTGNTKQQIEKSKTQNFDPKNILGQSVMRYNQLFSSKTTITIYADFSLHAGDLIYIDTPSHDTSTTKQMDDNLGGYYVIADLCHYINITEGGYTKITAVRDSVGKKGSPTYYPFGK